MAKYINKLAPTTIERGGGYTEDDVWDAHEKLKVVPRDTIQVREILTFWELIGSPVHSHGLMHKFMFRNPAGHPPWVTAYHPTPVLSSHHHSPRLRWAHLDSNHDIPTIVYQVQTLIPATGVKMKM